MPTNKTFEPTSFEQIYDFLDQSLTQCSNDIDETENDYYQTSPSTPKGKSSHRSLAVSTLTSWSPLLNELRDARLLRDIRNGKTIRELLSDARIGTLYGPVADESVVLMKRILDKTNEQLYSKIPNLVQQISQTMDMMERYFLSFYEIENIEEILQNKRKEIAPDKFLETVYNYEKSRWSHMFQVNKALKVLREMSQRVEDPKGVILSTLSKDCQELALRCECAALSYIFALPECYVEARRSLVELRTWLNEDKDYNDFVQNSLKIVEEKFVETKKLFDQSKIQLSQIEYRAESQRSQLNKLEEENQINERKLEDFETRRNQKEREYISRRLTFEVYTEQLNKLMKPVNDQQSTIIDNRLSIERFQQELKEIRRDVRRFKSQVDAIQTRIRFFEERKAELIQMRDETKKLEREVQLALEEKILKENQHRRIESCRDVLRQIYKCRISHDLPQKIFHALPVKTKHTFETDDDELSKAFRIISKSIGRDWTRLYWQLPFYPTRGQEELAKDIQQINEKYQRGDVFQDQSMSSLNKWRRFHTRAKLEDLTSGLEKIRRHDLLQLLERKILKPKHLLNVEHVEIDPRKKEIEDLNRKLNRLFEKIRTGTFVTASTNFESTPIPVQIASSQQ